MHDLLLRSWGRASPKRNSLRVREIIIAGQVTLDLDISRSPDRVIFLTKNRPLRCRWKGRDASPTLDPISTAIGYACLFSGETKLVTKGVRGKIERDQVKQERKRERIHGTKQSHCRLASFRGEKVVDRGTNEWQVRLFLGWGPLIRYFIDHNAPQTFTKLFHHERNWCG